MKSRDNDIDRALRVALKRKFDNFEADVDKTSDDIIFSALKTSYWQSTKPRILLVAGFLILLLSGTLLYVSSIKVNHKASEVIVQKELFINLGRSQKGATGLELSKKKTLPLSNEKALIQLPVKMHPPKIGKLETTLKKHIPSKYSLLTVLRPAELTRVENDNSHLFITNQPKETEVEVSNRESTNRDLNLSGLDKQKTNLLLTEKIAPILHGPKKINNHPFVPYHFDLNLRSISAVNTGESQNKKINTKIKRFGFVLNVTPLNTIQVLTIEASPGIIYQNVSVPSKISLPRLGYKFTGGLTKGDFEFLLSYGRLSQSFGYEIVSDEFELKTEDSKDWNFVAKGIEYKENHKLNFVSIGLKRHNLVRNGSIFHNYFGDTGLEFSRELRTNTNVLWGNLAVGKQFSINKSTWLTIGPYAEYSFTKMVNPDTKFKIQPYQVGLSIGLKYIR